MLNPNHSQTPPIDNAFVLTGIGQMRNIYNFINQYHATHNIALVLYTAQNLTILETIKNNIDNTYFDHVYFYELPKQLLKEQIRKSKQIYAIFEEAVNQAVKTHHIQNLFLCMPNSHYSFFERICRKQNISINLIEEGLATYRIYQQEVDAHEYKPTSHDVCTSAMRVAKKFLGIFKQILTFVVALLRLASDILSALTGKNITYAVRTTLRKKQKYRYGLITEFDNVYVCYPELMSKLNPKAKAIHPLPFAYTDRPETFVLDEDKDGENILFVNQKYGIPYKDHFPIVFSILQEMGVTTVYIKFHPKEDLFQMQPYFDEAIQQFPSLRVIPLEGLNDVPIENLLNANHITKLMGLTSSSLFFSKLVNPNIETVSIAEEYKKRCEELNVSEGRMKNFLTDYTYMDKIFHVTQYAPNTN